VDSLLSQTELARQANSSAGDRRTGEVTAVVSQEKALPKECAIDCLGESSYQAVELGTQIMFGILGMIVAAFARPLWSPIRIVAMDSTIEVRRREQGAGPAIFSAAICDVSLQSTCAKFANELKRWCVMSRPTIVAIVVAIVAVICTGWLPWTMDTLQVIGGVSAMFGICCFLALSWSGLRSLIQFTGHESFMFVVLKQDGSDRVARIWLGKSQEALLRRVLQSSAIRKGDRDSVSDAVRNATPPINISDANQ
jgi:hypothetical protein